MSDLMEQPGLYNYWVVPGRLMAGEHPASFNDENTRRSIQRLLEAGIAVMIDLTQGREAQENPLIDPNQPEQFLATPQPDNYDRIAIDLADRLGLSLEYEQIGIRDGNVPNHGQMVYILNKIDESIARNKPVYVHCLAGLGRTGTVVGCYLVRHGMSGEQALEEIARLRQNSSDPHSPSPQTEAQRAMVRSWKVGQ